MGAKILVITTDLEYADILAYALRRNGYRAVVVTDGEAALRLWPVEEPDLAIVRAELPRLTGWELCRRVRSSELTPFILVGTTGEVDEVVRALDLGADDVITERTSLREVLARTRAVLRRALALGGQQPLRRLQVGHLVVDPATYAVSAHGQIIHLTRLEFQVLYELALHAGHVLTPQVLSERVWGYDTGGSGPLKTHIRHLREKLEVEPSAPRLLITIPGVGYSLRVPPDELQEPEEDAREGLPLVAAESRFDRLETYRSTVFQGQG